MWHRASIAIGALVLLAGCRPAGQPLARGAGSLVSDTSIRYARRFAIANGADFSVIYLFANKHNFDTTGAFVLYADSTALRHAPPGIPAVMIPCRRIAALSSIYAAMICELRMGENLVAIDNMDYVNDPEIIARFRRGQLKELAKTPQVDIEQTVTLKPDMVFTFGMGDWEREVDQKLAQTHIPVAISLDHKEENPLARAEWIKFYGAFLGKRRLADSIFAAVEKNYHVLKALANKAATRPTVFNETKYGDSWYIPGGKSYIARLLDDAAANYLWKENRDFGSLPLSFEQVYAKARNADFWINLSTIKTKRELLGYESRYAGFNAFKNGNLYNNTKITNSKGYSIYWESGMIHPDRILSDLIWIFHPNLRPELKNELYYYEQIK